MAERTIEDRQGDLVTMIQGRSNEQITAGVEARGAEKVLRSVFDGMAEAFVPERAAGEDAVIQYHVTVGDKTYPVARDANIQIEGKTVRLTGVPVGISVSLRLNADRKTVGMIFHVKR